MTIAENAEMNAEDALPEDDNAPEVESEAAVKRIGVLEEQLATAKQDILYAHAETQNVRRRLEKELADARAYSVSSFAREILSVADNLERGISTIPADLRGDDRFKGLVVGLDATLKEMENVLRKNGIEKFVSIGQQLDPNRHQAMIEMPNPDVPPGTIVQELQPGYMVRDRLLRPALVGVAKAPE